MSEKWKIYYGKWENLWRVFFKCCFYPALVCECFVELCSRRSSLNFMQFLSENLVVFLYNVLIIAVTASVCLLFRRSMFVLFIILLLWCTIGVTDFVLLSFRTTPFTAVDLALIQDALQVADRYLSGPMIVLIILGILAAVAASVYLFRNLPKSEGDMEYGIRIPFCGFLVLLCLALTNVGMHVNLLDRNFGNLAQAFHENGLPYCFMNSVLNTGVKRPGNYSEEAMGDFLETFEKEEGKELVTGTPLPTIPLETVTPVITPILTQNSLEEVTPTAIPERVPTEQLPNVIFLQLESFFDVKYIKNFSCSEDPIPFFTELKEKYPSGFLEVPSIGAGTANTEFECITGMNLDLFGPGEYPYKTILKERTCESMAYILKKLGHSASAMHNNDGTFYGRNVVFSNLGFDRYISVEYMAEAEVNELNWARDKVLVEQIRKVLEKTEERDYIYAISVQGHGAYPELPLLSEHTLDIQLPEELADYQYQYLYYVHQLKEMDDFLQELTENLSACNEEVVLVLYGDHLPSLGLSDELLENQNAFQTEYVIWNNYGLTAENKDIQSYQLGARVLELLGVEEGIMPQYHTYRKDEEDYLEKMQMLMYDMLYGDMNVYEGENPYEPAELQMGIDKIRIWELHMKLPKPPEEDPALYVFGQNFTEWSKVAVNGEEVETMFLNERLLLATGFEMSEEGRYEVTVRQQGNDRKILSETESVEYFTEE